MEKPNKIRLILHIQSLHALCQRRSITFNHPKLDVPIEIILGDDILHLDLLLQPVNEYIPVDITKMD